MSEPLDYETRLMMREREIENLARKLCTASGLAPDELGSLSEPRKEPTPIGIFYVNPMRSIPAWMAFRPQAVQMLRIAEGDLVVPGVIEANK